MVERAGTEEKLDIGTRIIAFIGPEGSGKTTLALELSKNTSRPYISTRKILENLRDNDPGPFGDEVRKMFNDKVYLAGETLLKILVERFSKDDLANGFILDGGFRTVEETRDFRKMLKLAGRDYPVDIRYLKIPKEISYERLIDGAKARKRNDDTPEALEKRLSNFYLQLEERQAIIKSEEGWRIIEIDATPTPEKVYEKILESLKNLK